MTMTMTAAPARARAQRTPDRPATPYVSLDPYAAVARLAQLSATLPVSAVHYAVRANPHPTLLRALAVAGAGFDAADPAELRACLAAGADPSRVLYSQPVKRWDHIAEAADLGVDLFVVDSPEEVVKVFHAAPDSRVLCRLAVGPARAADDRRGCPPEAAGALLRFADRIGLRAAGLRFHVGSEQRDPGAWSEPIATAAKVFKALRRDGLDPDLLDLGGGLPARLGAPYPNLRAYAGSIRRALAFGFGDDRPRTILTPGHTIAGPAGELVCTVVEVLSRGTTRWVFLDAGVYGGMLGPDVVAKPVRTDRGGPTGPCVLAGPTCDSADVLCERSPVPLPLSLAAGDQVRISSAGAYLARYSGLGPAGFAPVATRLAS